MWDDDNTLSLSDLSKQHFGNVSEFSFLNQALGASQNEVRGQPIKDVASDSPFTLENLSLEDDNDALHNFLLEQSNDIEKIFNNQDFGVSFDDGSNKVESAEVDAKSPSEFGQLLCLEIRHKKIASSRRLFSNGNFEWKRNNLHKEKMVLLTPHSDAKIKIKKFDFNTLSPDGVVVAQQKKSTFGYGT